VSSSSFCMTNKCMMDKATSARGLHLAPLAAEPAWVMPVGWAPLNKEPAFASIKPVMRLARGNTARRQARQLPLGTGTSPPRPRHQLQSHISISRSQSGRRDGRNWSQSGVFSPFCRFLTDSPRCMISCLQQSPAPHPLFPVPPPPAVNCSPPTIVPAHSCRSGRHCSSQQYPHIRD
jgi:hypothetical protein